MKEMIMLWFNQETGDYHMGTENDFHNELREYSSGVLAIKYKMEGSQWNVLKKIEAKLNKSTVESGASPII